MSSPHSIAFQRVAAELKPITDFIEGQHSLPLDKKRESLLTIDKLFTDHAYKAQLGTIKTMKSDGGYLESVVPTLKSAAIETGLGKHLVYRLIANIVKAYNLVSYKEKESIPTVSEFRPYQKDGSKNDRFSGWINEKYLKGMKAPNLEKTTRKFFISEAEVEPFTFLAIQNLQEAIDNIKKGASGTVLPYNMFIEAALFATRWNSIEMLKDLAKIKQAWGGFPSPSRHEEYRRARELYGKEKIVQAVKSVYKFSEYAVSISEIPHLDTRMEEDAESPRFDPANPVESIVQFTGNCCTLPTAEQRCFVNSVRKFFLERLNERGTVEIPKKYENTFSLLSLPLLMKAMQVRTEERRRFLAAVQNVTSRSFPQLCTADQVQLVYPRIAKADGSPSPIAWIPADEITVIKSPSSILTPMRASEPVLRMLANMPQAAPDELIACLFFATSNNCDRLTEEIKTLINERLCDPSARRQLIDVLVRELHHKEIQRIASENDLQFDRESAKNLSEEELLYLLLYVTKMKVAPPQPSIDSKSFQPDDNTLEIMKLFTERCDRSSTPGKYTLYKHAVATYAYNMLTGQIHSSTRHADLLSTPLNHLFSMLKKAHGDSKDHGASLSPDDLLKELSISEINDIFNYLKDPKSSVFAQLAEQEYERQLILEKMVSAHPELKAADQMKELVNSTFPELKNAEDHPLYKALDAVMKKSLNPEWPYNISYDISRNKPLSKDKVLEVRDALARTNSDPHFIRTFRIHYNVDRLEFEERVRKELELVGTQDRSVPKEALAFVSDLSLKQASEGIFASLIIAHGIEGEAIPAVLHLLTLNDEIKSAFESHRNAFYLEAVAFIARCNDAVSLAGEFMGTFKIPLPNQTRSETSRCEAFLVRVLRMIYSMESKSMLPVPIVNSLKDKGIEDENTAYPKELAIQACLLFSLDDVKEWFAKRELKWMPDALKQTFRSHVEPFDRGMEIVLFMSLIKAKNRLSDQAIECLDHIFDVLNEKEQERILNRLKTGTSFSKLPAEDIDAIKSLLNDKQFTGILIHRDTTKMIERLRKTLDQTDDAPKIPDPQTLRLTH